MPRTHAITSDVAAWAPAEQTDASRSDVSAAQ